MDLFSQFCTCHRCKSDHLEGPRKAATSYNEKRPQIWSLEGEDGEETCYQFVNYG
jgi:hypothetical protein